jgi:ketosteroid isomerase-like protein
VNALGKLLAGSPSVGIAQRWLDTLARADFGAWPELVAVDVRMKFPFAPPGIPSGCEGRDACLAMIQGFFSVIQSFSWHDVQLYQALDPELVFGTARSEVMTIFGKPYRNDYCVLLRLRAGKLQEYHEYFNPLPAMAVFARGAT